MPNSSSLKIGVAQVETVPGDLVANLQKHLAMIEAGRAQGLDILLFPEMSLTGHNVGAETLRLAIFRDDAIVGEIARASGPMCAIFGLIEESVSAQFFNTAIAVRDGGIVFIHRKINLATYGKLEEGKHFANGRYVETFEMGPRWRASVLICNDLWNPPLVHIAAVHGATVLFAPISSAVEAVGFEFDNPGGWAVNLQFYAMTYGMPVIMANRIGVEGDLTFWGGSRILDAFGKTLAQAGEGEELISTEIDYEHVRLARYLLPTLRDSNLGLIDREVDRLVRIVGVPESVRIL
ncbi:MAG: nitrilase [Proteobacteria bacterium]|nr:nitrilase [Pseudomonadota bacterium]